MIYYLAIKMANVHRLVIHSSGASLPAAGILGHD
jgi:hypothetical protein